MRSVITHDQLDRALSLRDLSDPATGPHAMQLVVDAIRRELERAWGCPVLVHRSWIPLGRRRRGVVVGVDGAEGSAGVLDAAAREADLRGEPLHVVHAWRQLTEDAVQPLRWRLDADASTSAETAAVEPLVAALRSRLPGLPVTSKTLPFLVRIVGVWELSMRLPGAIRFGAVPMVPLVSVRPGCQLKSIISLLSKKPAPWTTMREP